MKDSLAVRFTRKSQALAFATAMALVAVNGSHALGQEAPNDRIAQPSSPAPAGSQPPRHEQIHQMIDQMHGAGMSQRVHEAMGPDAEVMMNHLAAMQGMMATMQRMMGSGAMASQPANQQVMQDMLAMGQDMSGMMLQMMGMMAGMGDGMSMDMGQHNSMMGMMMQRMTTMMEHMMANMEQAQRGAPRAPVQLPTR